MTNEIEIDKCIPIPETRGRAGQSRYANAIKRMKVGDSFVIPEGVRNAISGVAKKCGVVLTVRKVKDGEVRVWLVSKTRAPKT